MKEGIDRARDNLRQAITFVPPDEQAQRMRDQNIAQIKRWICMYIHPHRTTNDI